MLIAIAIFGRKALIDIEAKRYETVDINTLEQVKVWFQWSNGNIVGNNRF